MNINSYLSKQYSYPPCWELVAAVYVNELSCSVNSYTSSTSFKSIASAFRLALHKGDHGFVQINTPKDYCVVLMGKTENGPMHHVGVFYRGSVLHALQTGNLYQDISSLSDQFKQIQYWEKVV